MLFRVSIGARKVGAIGQHGAVKRVYEIESAERSTVAEMAINRAYMDGDIEHVTVTSIGQIIGEVDAQASRITTGTSHFVSYNSALRYFAYENATDTDIDRKIAEGLIQIGKPALKPGQKLSIIDDGTRYAIED